MLYTITIQRGTIYSIARAWEEARRRTKATTTTRSSEGMITKQRKTAEGDQPSILN